MDEAKPHMSSIMESLSAPLWILGALIAFIANELTVTIKRDLKRNIQHTSGSRGCIVGVAPYHMMSSVPALLACGCMEGQTQGELRAIQCSVGLRIHLHPPLLIELNGALIPKSNCLVLHKSNKWLVDCLSE